MPLVAERLGSRLGIAMTETANPRHAVALGAASTSSATAAPVADSPLPSDTSGTSTSPFAPATTITEPPAVAELLTQRTVPPPRMTTGHSPSPTEATQLVGQPELVETSTLTSPLTRLLVFGSVAALVVGAITALWLLDDQSSAQNLEASGAGQIESVEQFSGLPTDGFEFSDGVRSGQNFGGFAAPLSDPGPDSLPQRLWQNQFSGMFKRPVGHSAVLIVEEIESGGPNWANRVVAVDPRSGANQWSFETRAFLQHYFVGDDGVAVLLTDTRLDAEGELLQVLLVVLLDSETGQPTTRLDVTPPSVDLALDQLVGAELVENILITTWFDGAELVTSAFDVSAVEPLWQERDPAPRAPSGYGGAGDGSTYVVFGDGTLVARDLRTGERLWSTTEVDFSSVRAVSGGVVVLSSVTGRTDYVGHDLRSGDRRWTVAKGLTFRFAADDAALYAIESNSASIYSLNLSDGTLRWETRIASQRDLPTDLVLAGDHVYLLDVDANLTLFDRRNGDAIWSTNVGDIGEFPQLTTAGDVVFIQSGESVVAFG